MYKNNIWTWNLRLNKMFQCYIMNLNPECSDLSSRPAFFQCLQYLLTLILLFRCLAELVYRRDLLHSFILVWECGASLQKLLKTIFSPGSHNNFFWHQCDQSIYHFLCAHRFLPAIWIYYWQGWVLKLLWWLQIIGCELLQRDTFVFFSPFFFIFLSCSTF